MSATDRNLIARIATDADADAFSLLVDRHRDMVFAACSRILGNAVDAEEAAQICFFRLFKNASSLRGSAAAWLHGVAVHVSIDMIRRAKTRRVREKEAGTLRLSEEQRDWGELRALVDEEIAQLSESRRTAVVLHYLQRRPQREIAEELGVTQPRVSQLLNEALTALRKAVARKGWSGSFAVLAAFMAERTLEAAPATLTAALGKMAMAGVGSSVPAGAAGGIGTAGTVTASATAGGIGIMKLSLVGLAAATVVTAAVMVTHVGGQENAVPEATQPQPVPSVVTAETFTSEDWQALLTQALAAEAKIKGAKAELEIVEQGFPAQEDDLRWEQLEEQRKSVIEGGETKVRFFADIYVEDKQKLANGWVDRKKNVVTFYDDKFCVEESDVFSDMPVWMSRTPFYVIAMDDKTLQHYAPRGDGQIRMEPRPTDITKNILCKNYVDLLEILKPFTTILAKCEFVRGYIDVSENETEPNMVLEFVIPEDVSSFLPTHVNGWGVGDYNRSMKVWMRRDDPVLLRLEFMDEKGRLTQRVVREGFMVTPRLREDADLNSTSMPASNTLEKQLPWLETREYWSSEGQNGMRIKTVVKITKIIDLRFIEDIRHVEGAFDLNTFADTEIAENMLNPVIEAVQYREEFLPAGFELSERVPGFPENPGIASAEKLEEIQKEFAIALRLEWVYACNFKCDEPRGGVGYGLMKVTNSQEADELCAAIRKMAAAGFFYRVYQHDIYVLYVGGSTGTAQQVEELAEKLEDALGASSR